MLTEEEVQHIATLARIGLRDDEIEKYRNDLSDVLDFFKELEELKADPAMTDGVPEKRDDYREDDVREAGAAERELILGNVPDMKDAHIRVKSVF